MSEFDKLIINKKIDIILDIYNMFSNNVSLNENYLKIVLSVNNYIKNKLNIKENNIDISTAICNIIDAIYYMNLGTSDTIKDYYKNILYDSISVFTLEQMIILDSKKELYQICLDNFNSLVNNKKYSKEIKKIYVKERLKSS